MTISRAGAMVTAIAKDTAMKVLDPGNPVDKIQLKASITEAIAKQVAGSNRDDIARKVEDEYERLLARAVINTHIPSLTAGTVRREVTASSVKLLS